MSAHSGDFFFHSGDFRSGDSGDFFFAVAKKKGAVVSHQIMSNQTTEDQQADQGEFLGIVNAL